MPIVTDKDCHDFVRSLDDSDRVEVSDWEAKFLESALRWTGVFTAKQSDAITRMMIKYADRIGFLTAQERGEEPAEVKRTAVAEEVQGTDF